MIARIMRAIRLDWTVFREIAEDANAMSEAAIIVVIVTFLSALGGAIGADSFFLNFFVGWIAAIVVGWILWAVITYFVGTALFKGQTTIPEMMRVLGYASAPQLLGLLSFIPCVGFLFALAGWLLSLIAGFIAVREAMEFDTGTALATVVISWIAAFVINLLIRLPLTGMAMFSGL
jgi:hypothetical protein